LSSVKKINELKHREPKKLFNFCFTELKRSMTSANVEKLGNETARIVTDFLDSHFNASILYDKYVQRYQTLEAMYHETNFRFEKGEEVTTKLDKLYRSISDLLMQKYSSPDAWKLLIKIPQS